MKISQLSDLKQADKTIDLCDDLLRGDSLLIRRNWDLADFFKTDYRFFSDEMNAALKTHQKKTKETIREAITNYRAEVIKYVESLGVEFDYSEED